MQLVLLCAIPFIGGAGFFVMRKCCTCTCMMILFLHTSIRCLPYKSFPILSIKFKSSSSVSCRLNAIRGDDLIPCEIDNKLCTRRSRRYRGNFRSPVAVYQYLNSTISFYIMSLDHLQMSTCNLLL